MDFSQTSPESLTKAVLSNFGKRVNYALFPTNGAENAAILISQVMNERR
jgi:hypothetical protein